MSNTVNWEALRDLSRVCDIFEKRDIKLHVAHNGNIHIQNFCFPFIMEAVFEGDGVCHVHAIYEGELLARKLYDSHWKCNSLTKFFESCCKDTYEEAAKELLRNKKEELKGGKKLRDWAVKWSGFMIQLWAKKLSDASSTDKVRSFAAQRCSFYSDIATYLVSN